MFILINISLFQSFNPVLPLRLNSTPSPARLFSLIIFIGYKGLTRD